jgi:hypothetical protein
MSDEEAAAVGRVVRSTGVADAAGEGALTSPEVVGGTVFGAQAASDTAASAVTAPEARR